MKKIYAAACVVACCMGNPAGANEATTEFNKYTHRTRWGVVNAAAICMHAENVWSKPQVLKYYEHARESFGIRLTDYKQEEGVKLITNAIDAIGGCKQIVRDGLNSPMDRWVRGIAKPAQLY